ncbi:hypothetical protein ENUP19_0201G0004 [Entamoeba nuttalli]|uniref:Vesicle transport protein n=2 Tax=Entamoeba nuttalli TaxID=412467 RepID=K2GEA1_ENTNP|nr:hypothetical protein ENU1_074920 [Entamoeba nuttalli P19]EKE40926.1 hypothetical protein ENU1_074920 [Entamoeba nuttalli P19]|eukprot:XP_008856737.1 hypothetical protein ENU1_074920 [Entamoeba nuttalli P19]
MEIKGKNNKQEGIITFHRDTMNELFISEDKYLLCCIKLHPMIRFIFFIISFLIGLTALLLTLPLTGLYVEYPVILGIVYIISKLLLYSSLLFIASPWKQLILICRPVRFSTLAFCIIGVVGIWLSIFHIINSLLILILSILLQALCFTLYCLSYLSFTHNILFDCIKRPKISLLTSNLKQRSLSELPEISSTSEISNSVQIDFGLEKER